MNFSRGPETLENKGRKIRGINSLEVFAENFVCNSPKNRQTKLKVDPRSALQNLGQEIHWGIFKRTRVAKVRKMGGRNPKRGSQDPKGVISIYTPRYGVKKSTQTLSGQSFSRTLNRVMDVRAENRERPHQKVVFSAVSVMGRNFLTKGHPGVRVRTVRGKSGLTKKSMFLLAFSFLTRVTR